MIDTKHAFPDANVLLHFPAFDGLDWCDLCKANAVVVHITQPVMRELNKLKDTGHSKAIRRRAANVQRTLRKLLNTSGTDAPLSSNVTIHLESRSPLLTQFPTLDPAISDDVLIAAILTVRDSTAPDVALVTDDSGLALVVKATEWKIQVIEPPPKLRLPPEQDNDEKERVRLLQRIRELEESRADLDLHFAGGGSVLNVSLLIDHVEDYVVSRLEALKRKHQKLPIPGPPSEQAAAPSNLTLADLVKSGSDSPISRNVAEDYNRTLDKFFSKAEQVLRRNAAIKARMARVEFEIANNGPAPANDILAQLHFPDKARPYKPDEATSVLQKLPTPPPNPSSLSPFILPQFTTPLERPTLPRSPFEPSLSIRHINSYEVNWKTLKLRQGHMETIGPLLILFDDQPFSFEINYAVVADNSKGIRRGSLHVVMQGQRNTTEPG